MIIKNPIWGIVLSAFVVPGLGQILTNRLGKGLAMMGLLALWLPVLVIKVLIDLGHIVTAMEAQNIKLESLEQIQVALMPFLPTFTFMLIPLLAIWFWAVGDAVFFAIKSKRN